MSLVQLALYKGRGQIGNAAIRWWTGSIYSHCELVVEGWCYSSSVMDKGVRRKRVGRQADQISLSADHWDLIDLPWADGSAIVSHFHATDDDAYGWPSLIASQVLNRNRPSEHAAFCSEWCARALGLPCPSIYSPAAMEELCKWWSLRLHSPVLSL